MEEASMEPGLSWVEDGGVSDGPHAGFLDRVSADIVDGLFLFAPAGLFFITGFGRQVDAIWGPDTLLLPSDVVYLGLTLLVVWWIGRTGQTPGRRIMEIRVVDRDGEAIGFGRSLGRYLFAAFVSSPLFFAGFLWILADKRNQAWHDKVVGSYVIPYRS